MSRRIVKERDELNKLAGQYKKREYACEPDSKKEFEMLTGKKLAKIQYHTVGFQIIQEEKRGRGRPKKNQAEEEKQYVYHLLLSATLDEDGNAQRLKQQATLP